ncbi:MAG: hypothetical protein Q8K58_07345 [Acidimicrobiales bacterium]|nr:hypothetical protein [Acidimicrobiales bacterium]
MEVLNDLRTLGFTEDVLVSDEGELCCRVCGHCTGAPEMDLMELRRLEGASDPADMAAVLGLRCAECGALGTAIVRFGPEGSEADDIVLAHLPDHRRDDVGDRDRASD